MQVLTQRGAGVQIDTAVPLAEAARAHDRGETNRAGGKIVLAVAP